MPSEAMEAVDALASVVDVYDLASEIGKEFERLIDAHGADSLTNMMPKVVSALEQLERLAMKNEREDASLSELRARVALLETDKREKAQERAKFEKELEQIEEHWRSESRELVALVGRLQEENRRLAGQLEPMNSPAADMEASFVGRLRDDADVLREENRSKERELQQHRRETDQLTTQLERSTAVAKELRRKQKTYQAQVRNLLEERAEFLAQLQEQGREITALKGAQFLAHKDEASARRGAGSTESQLAAVLAEKAALEARLQLLEAELAAARPPPPLPPATEEEEEAAVQGPLPYEPDDVPWKRSESGVRKFFRRLFGEAHQLASPQRSLSALSKLALSSDPLP